MEVTFFNYWKYNIIKIVNLLIMYYYLLLLIDLSFVTAHKMASPEM